MPDRDLLFLHLRDLPYFRALLRAVEAQFYQDLDLPSPTLDLGCGDGHFASLTFRHRLEVGLDPGGDSLGEARRRGAYRWLVRAEGAAMPFPSDYFASALSNSVLEHIPQIDAVLTETARLLRPGAPFVFCVPNPRYFSALSLTRWLGPAYRRWFGRISRLVHADEPPVWEARLEAAGFRLERWWHYFSPAAMRVLEWGHYLGLPSLVARKLTGRWILVPARANLWLTERCIRRYASPEPLEDGVFTFYIARRRPLA
ncbi:MAG: class I SAM-dependent methyltransferase [Anaerolineales bacterium]